MSLKRILIIKQYRDSNLEACKDSLETSPEQYSVVIANSYDEGRIILRGRAENESEQLRLVLIDADDVDAYTLELIENIRSADNYLPVIVMTKLAGSQTRQSLTLLSSECIIKTGEYNKFLWHAVKGSLERNSNRLSRSVIKQKKVFRPFAAAKKKV